MLLQPEMVPVLGNWHLCLVNQDSLKGSLSILHLWVLYSYQRPVLPYRLRRCQSDISRYQIRPIEAHVSPSAYRHELTTASVSNSPFTESCLPCTPTTGTTKPAPCGFLFKHGVVSDSSYLGLFSTDVDRACLVTCLGHVSFRVKVHDLHIHQNWVWAINFDVMSIYFHESRANCCE